MNRRHRAEIFAVLMLVAGLACAPKPGGVAPGGAISLPFIENDFSGALSRAKEANLPLFVEVWAPW